MVDNTMLKYCKLVVKGNTSLAKKMHIFMDQHKLQAKLLPTVPQKVARQAASRVGLPVAKG